MSKADLLATLGETLAFVAVAIVLGDVVVRLAMRLAARAAGVAPPAPYPSVERVGAVLLAGFAACSYAGLLLALCRVFYWWSIVAIALATLVLGYRILTRYSRWVRGRTRRALLALRSPVIFLVVFVSVAILIANYAAGLAPPTLPDELSYHLPQAQQIVDSHHVRLDFGGHYFAGHYFYGNIPKLVEVVFAEAIAVGPGFALARVMQLVAVVGLVLLIGGIFRRVYNLPTALAAVLLVLCVDDFTQWAASGYVDSTSVCYELAALVTVASWAENRRIEDAALSALFAGLGLAVKYTAAATAVYVAVLVLVVAVRRLGIRRALGFTAGLAAIAFAACGFWYAKNLIRYGNPFYPLVFGHRGVSNLDYTELLTAIHQFGPRTLHAFLHVPERFANPSALPVFLGFYVFPFLALVHRARTFSIVIAAYIPLYTAYWFFAATHQQRFLTVAETAAALCVAVVLFALEPLPARAAAALAGVVVVALYAPHALTRFGEVNALAGDKFRKGSWTYVLGAQSQTAYLRSTFGCQFAAADYAQKFHANVIDNWSIWHEYQFELFEPNSRFVNFAGSTNRRVLWRQLRAGDYRYVYVRASTKATFMAETDPQMVAYRKLRAPAEQMILQRSKLVWRLDDCELYKIGGLA